MIAGGLPGNQLRPRFRFGPDAGRRTPGGRSPSRRRSRVNYAEHVGFECNERRPPIVGPGKGRGNRPTTRAKIDLPTVVCPETRTRVNDRRPLSAENDIPPPSRLDGERTPERTSRPDRVRKGKIVFRNRTATEVTPAFRPEPQPVCPRRTSSPPSPNDALKYGLATAAAAGSDRGPD